MAEDINISIVIRTFNEDLHLSATLCAIEDQQLTYGLFEVIVVDSGSNDLTIDIARNHNCRIVDVSNQTFSFGKSLNFGCSIAKGTVLVFLSAHCIPQRKDWLQRLTEPIVNQECDYAYGRQTGGHNSRFSEAQIFEKHFPKTERFNPGGFFCNNANAALSQSTWEKLRFNENVTGLEDLELAQRLCADAQNLCAKKEIVQYVPDAVVTHLHNESWPQVKRRFEREAIALRSIRPEFHFSEIDFLRCIIGATVSDWAEAYRRRQLISTAFQIVSYRTMQYWGVYCGNKPHRTLSDKEKQSYFYPKKHSNHSAQTTHSTKAETSKTETSRNFTNRTTNINYQNLNIQDLERIIDELLIENRHLCNKLAEADVPTTPTKRNLNTTNN